MSPLVTGPQWCWDIRSLSPRSISNYILSSNSLASRSAWDILVKNKPKVDCRAIFGRRIRNVWTYMKIFVQLMICTQFRSFVDMKLKDVDRGSLPNTRHAAFPFSGWRFKMEATTDPPPLSSLPSQIRTLTCSRYEALPIIGPTSPQRLESTTFDDDCLASINKFLHLLPSISQPPVQSSILNHPTHIRSLI